jgi:SPX domain protein involved in polyphosphate accumulation
VGWTAKDENEFTVMLTKELDKIHDFQKVKVGCFLRFISSVCSFAVIIETSELSRRIREAEKDVQRLVAEELSSDEPPSHRSSSPDPESQQIQREAYAPDGGSDDDMSDDEEEQSYESFDALQERFHGLEEEVAILVADVHDLALYTKLNITGFMKILKASHFALKPPA